MKHYTYILLLALALVGCEKNAQEAENTKYKDFSVATYIYYYDDWSYETWAIDSIPSTYGEIAFADDYRCATYTRLDKHNERAKTQSDYFYYELDYPYINLYNVSGFFRWDFTQETPFVRASTKEELQAQITGKAGVLKFATDTTALHIDGAYSNIPFFTITGNLDISENIVTDPTKLFPVPSL